MNILTVHGHLVEIPTKSLQVKNNKDEMEKQDIPLYLKGLLYLSLARPSVKTETNHRVVYFD